MTDLAEFLLARIQEDEAAAKDAGANVWTEQSSGVLDTGEWPDGVHALGDSRVTRFIAEHDPVRVLAECDTKRRIIKTLSWDDDPWRGARDYLLMLLALPYADHDAYREEWKP